MSNDPASRRIIVRSAYDKIASSYNTDLHIFDNSLQIQKFKDQLTKGRLILDAGCGPGVITGDLIESALSRWY